jgi:phosphopantetheinyl transferase
MTSQRTHRGFRLHLLPRESGWTAIIDVLALWTGLSPAQIEVIRSPRGKPRLRGGQLEFSISHAPGILAVLVSFEGPVGLDIERADRQVDVRRLAPRVFSGTPLHQLQENADSRLFLRHWTRLEALAKASGEGLATARLARRTRSEFELEPVNQWMTRDLDVGPGWIAAAALPVDAENHEVLRVV